MHAHLFVGYVRLLSPSTLNGSFPTLLAPPVWQDRVGGLRYSHCNRYSGIVFPTMAVATGGLFCLHSAPSSVNATRLPMLSTSLSRLTGWPWGLVFTCWLLLSVIFRVCRSIAVEP